MPFTHVFAASFMDDFDGVYFKFLESMRLDKVRNQLK